MKNKTKFFKIIFSFAVVIFIQFGCKTNNNEQSNLEPLDENYINKINDERNLKDSIMQFNPYSPFNKDPEAEFTKLNYYEPNNEFIFKSKLYEYEPKDTVDVYGTRGELRRVIKFGYIILDYKNDEYKITVYKGFDRRGAPYHSIWFTDKTTGKETYGVGRYLDFEKEDDPDHIYTIDFNRAYNPYCAYSPIYTCPIPREEDYIDFEIKAGEKKFHSD